MVKGNIDNRGIHDLDESREHYCECDDPFIHERCGLFIFGKNLRLNFGRVMFLCALPFSEDIFNPGRKTFKQRGGICYKSFN